MKERRRFLTHLWVACLILLGGRPVASQEAPKANSGRVAQRPVSNEQTSETEGSPDGAVDKPDPRYAVQTSDTLDLTFMLTPDFDQTVTVQPDGYITLREAGEVLAAGKTLPELGESIKKAYGKILHDPMVSINPKDFEKPYFLVGGQVGKPGKFDWRGEVTLTEAITIAGGFSDSAKHSQVLVFRRVSGEWAEAKLIDVKKMLREKNLQEDVVLQPGDMVYVPKNTISKIKPYIPAPTLGVYANQF